MNVINFVTKFSTRLMGVHQQKLLGGAALFAAKETRRQLSAALRHHCHEPVVC